MDTDEHGFEMEVDGIESFMTYCAKGEALISIRQNGGPKTSVFIRVNPWFNLFQQINYGI